MKATNGAEIRVEGKRGCGYRKVKGVYLVAPALSRPCGRLPTPLTVCQHCGAGFKFARGWTWADADAIPWADCRLEEKEGCYVECPLRLTRKLGRCGLLWVGVKHYPLVSQFCEEAERMGVSRRLNYKPRKLEIGKTWVLLAHGKAITNAIEGTNGTKDMVQSPGIFRVFRPTALEIVVEEGTSKGIVKQMKAEGYTPVIVRRPEDAE